MPVRRVLVVHDDPVFLSAIADVFRLRLPDTVCEVCSSAPEALKRLSEQPYTLVLCDVRMPGLDGLIFLRAARAVCPTTPVAIITAHGDQSVAVMAHNAGAAAFIEKPFEREDLIERIEQLLLESPPAQLPPGLRG